MHVARGGSSEGRVAVGAVRLGDPASLLALVTEEVAGSRKGAPVAPVVPALEMAWGADLFDAECAFGSGHSFRRGGC